MQINFMSHNSATTIMTIKRLSASEQVHITINITDWATEMLIRLASNH
jgi:hypothetical protein